MDRLKYLSGILAAGVLAAASTGGGNRALQMQAIGRTPLSFQQIDAKKNSWMASGRGYNVVLGSDSATMRLRSGGASAAVRMRLVGANSAAPSYAQQPLPGKVNYFIGSDPKRWQTGISTFGRVEYRDVYDKTDVTWYGNQGQLEYDFRLKPGADPRRIGLGFDDSTKLTIEPNGDLRIGIGERYITLHAPSIYQEVNGIRKNIFGHYELRAANEIAFRIGAYDKSRTLVIDPSIAYSSYFGSDLTPNSIAVDSSGNVYIGGSSASGYVPVPGGSDTSLSTVGLGSESGVITKFNSSGTVVWSTFIGGSGQDAINGIAIDSSGDVFATGGASSTDFPVVNPVQASAGGTNNAFALELNASGSTLTYSTYMGGSSAGDSGSGIAVDASGNAYVTGTTYSTTFLGASTGSTAGEAYVVKLSPSGTLVGGFPFFVGSNSQGNAITADSTGAYVTGTTAGTSFTGISSPGPQATSGGGYDAFIMKVSSTGSPTWATFLGGSGDDISNAIVSDGTYVYVAGSTTSTNLPVSNYYQSGLKGSQNAFVAAIDASGHAFKFVTYLGGTNYDSASGLALDPSGGLVVVGNTGSTDFPTQNAIEPAFPSDASLFYYSTDGGNTWGPSRGLGTAYFLSNVSPDPSNPGTILATEAANSNKNIVNAIVRSTDYGQTWQTTYSSNNPIYSLARNPQTPTTLYAVDSSNKILRSTDNGATWSAISSVTSSNNIITVTNAGTVLVFGYDTANRVFRSTNNGGSFSAVTPGLATASIVTPAYAVVASDGPIFVGTSGGIYESGDDGQTWTFLSSAPSGGNNLALGQGASTGGLYTADCTNVYSNAGGSWASLLGAAGDGICFVAGSTNTRSIYGVTQTGDVFVSNDNGNSWVLTQSGVDNDAITGIIVDPTGNNIYLTSEAGGQTGFVTSMSTGGSTLNWSTFFGDSSQGSTIAGNQGFVLQAVAPNSPEGVWVTGQGSLNLPVTTPNTNGLDGNSSFIAQLSNATPSCSYSINPSSQYVYTTSTVYFSVTAPSGCQWTATADQTWISFKSGAGTVATPNSGSGTVVARVQGNNGPAVGHITILDQNSNTVATFNISEPAVGCTYSVSNPSWGAQAGGDVTLTVTPASGCSWDVQSLSGYSTVQTNGTTVTVTLPANGTINPQQYELEVAGQIVTINQASVCAYSGFPNGQTLTASGLAGSGSIPSTGSITASPSACGLNAFSDQSWLTVTNSGSTISYSYTGNYTGAPRTGHIYLNGQAYTITQSATSALQFVPMTPCRVADTRPSNESLATYPPGFGPPSLTANQPRTFAIQSGPCGGIPADVVAYSLNVTAVPQGTLGYLSIWPSDQTQPTVSILNSIDGRVKANAAIVAASSDGTASIKVVGENNTDIVLDIDGYFIPATDNKPNELAFYPMTPCRVADTRPPSLSEATYPGAFGPPYLSANTTRDFPLATSSCLNGVSGALAYSLNFTVVPHVPLGYLTAWPSDKTQPLVSTLNASLLVGNPPAPPVVANAAIVPAAQTASGSVSVGDINVFVTNDTDVIIDINGYFAAPGQANALSFYPATPCRVLDSRNPNNKGQAVSGLTAVQMGITGCGPFPSAQAYALNATVVPVNTLGFLTLWSDNGSQPLVSTLNSLDGSVTSNMAIVPTVYGNINAFVDNPTALILDYFGFFAP